MDFVFPRNNNLNYSSIHKYLTKKEIDIQSPKLKVLNSKSRKYLDGVFLASRYNNALIAELLERLKFGLEYKIVDDLVELLYQKVWVDSYYFIPDPDYIVPVPNDPKRFLQRGFSVSALIASGLAKKVDKLVIHIINKKISTIEQSKLEREKREKNLKGVFELAEKEYNLSQKEVIWLIDDVSTTGTTLLECAKLLKKKYPFLQIYGVVVSGNGLLGFYII
ncbi:ComF family protein [Candidatus Gracilibacteria bacterium]|nr:ComF family protein [Candidatus Gracilibacteria bacterium]